MKLVNIKAQGYYSGAVVESSYLLSDEFYEFVSEGTVFDSLGASELDGKHSYVEADVEVLSLESINTLDFTEKYFDDAVLENMAGLAYEVREEIEEGLEDKDEWEELISKFTEAERQLIREDGDWRDLEEFRKSQVALAEGLFEVPESYKGKLRHMWRFNPEEFYERAWKAGFLRD